MAEIKKIIAKIEKEENKLNKLISKRDAVNKEINEQQKIVDELKQQEMQYKLSQCANMANKQGISVDDLLKAISDGNLNELQSKLNKNNNAQNNKNIQSNSSENNFNKPNNYNNI